MSKDVLDTLIAEAGSDPDGLAAVAWVIQNRAQQWGLTPEQVVKQKGQFEGYSNPGPKSREAQKMPEVRAAAEKAWQAVQSGTIPDPTKGGTSFRTKGYKQPAPNGTVTIAGNTFALGTAKPNSALSAINAAAPTPMPSRPTALAYAPSASVPRPPSGSYTLPPPALDLNPPLPPRASSWQEKGGPVMRGDIPLPRPRPTPPAPARGVGTSYLAPATEVKTVKIDPLTGNPVTAQATAPRPVSKPPRVTFVPSTSTPTPFQTANRAVVENLPIVGPIVRGVGAAASLVNNRPSAGASAAPQPQPTKLPSVLPPAPKGYNTLTGDYEAMQPSTPYLAAPAPLRVADNKNQARLSTKAPSLQEMMGRPAAPPLVPARPLPPMPRMPMNPTAALIAARARIPTPPVPMARAPARIPLSQTRAVNPVSQIIPAIQARAGQGLFGQLFNMMTAGVVPQANTARPPTPAPPGYNGSTTVTSSDLRPTHSSIFSENALLPSAMNNRRWAGDGY